MDIPERLVVMGNQIVISYQDRVRRPRQMKRLELRGFECRYLVMCVIRAAANVHVASSSNLVQVSQRGVLAGGDAIDLLVVDCRRRRCVMS